MIAQGKPLAEVAKALEISDVRLSRWRSQYGGLKAVDAKRLKELGLENCRLKKMVAEQGLEIDMLKELAGKLLSPSRRRGAVRTLQERFGVSERRPCQVTGQHRATQRTVVRPVDGEGALRAQLRTISSRWPRYGFRRAWALLRANGLVVNRKRVQRLWRDEDFCRQQGDVTHDPC